MIFVPIGFLDGDSRPLPHEESLFARIGVRNATAGWERARRARGRAGFASSRTASATGRLAELEPAEALRARSRSRSCGSRSGSGATVEAYAYVKGSLADYRAEHASLVQQAGYKLGFTSVSGANGPASDRFRLLRYNVEPYSARTFELVLAGACDVISVKDTVPGTYARRGFNAVLGIATR